MGRKKIPPVGLEIEILKPAGKAEKQKSPLGFGRKQVPLGSLLSAMRGQTGPW